MAISLSCGLGSRDNLQRTFAQRYASDGTPRGGVLQVGATPTANNHYDPTVAMDVNGNFVITWSFYQTNFAEVLYAQRFNAMGESQGEDFRVTTTADGGRYISSVAMDINGNFVIAWTDNGSRGGYGIRARRYTSDGTSQGTEFRINKVANGEQKQVSVAMTASGNFVIAWVNYGGGNDIYARRFMANGTPQGDEFLVNTTTTDDQDSSRVAMDADGGIVIVWTNYSRTNGGRDVYARRFAADGSGQGAEFRVNPLKQSQQEHPSVAMNGNGNFVIVWTDARATVNSNSDWDVYAQRFVNGISLAPDADAYVQGASTTRATNYGAATEMQVKRTYNVNTGRGRRGFLRFDTSSVTGDITNARLRLYARLSDPGLPPTPMIVQKVMDTAWEELGVTWDTQPIVESPTALAQITVADAKGQYYEFDLTEFIRADARRAGVPLAYASSTWSGRAQAARSIQSSTRKRRRIIVRNSSSSNKPSRHKVAAATDETRKSRASIKARLFPFHAR
jgi:hypothetical protein